MLNQLDRVENLSLDFATKLWQVLHTKKSQEKTTLIRQDGIFEFGIRPFRLCNATNTLQILMDIVLDFLLWECVRYTWMTVVSIHMTLICIWST